MDDWSLKNKACFAGIGTSEYGNFPETDSYGLGAIALSRAVEDAGIKFEDIDGLIVNRMPSYERFAEIAQINPEYCLLTETPGRFSSVSMDLAAQALASGTCKVVALVYGNDGRSSDMKYGGEASPLTPWGFTSPGAVHSMMYQRHMHDFGTPSPCLQKPVPSSEKITVGEKLS